MTSLSADTFSPQLGYQLFEELYFIHLMIALHTHSMGTVITLNSFELNCLRKQINWVVSAYNGISAADVSRRNTKDKNGFRAQYPL